MRIRTLAISWLLALALAAGAIPSTSQAQSAGQQTFTNNANSTLANPIRAGSFALSVAAGTGALFPPANTNNGTYFIATLQHYVAGSVTFYEIIKVTGRSGDNMVISRGQEGTSAQAFNAGDTLALFPTAGTLANFVQPSQAQAQSYNYALDTGSANNYQVALTPPLTNHVVGMPIYFKAAHANTGASIFNDTLSNIADPIILPNGAALVGGEIPAGCLCTVVFDGTHFQLTDSSASVGFISAALANSPALGGDPTAPTAITGNTGTPIATLDFVHNTLAASPVLGGNPTAPTPSTGNSSTSISTTAFVQNTLGASPALGGTPTAPTAASTANTTQIASTAMVQSAIASVLSGSGGASGSITLKMSGAPNGAYIFKWGFHTPGTNAGAGLETISITGSGGAFPHNMYFAAAFSNRSSTGVVGTGAVNQASLSTTQFQAVLDQDGSGNRSGLWFAIGD